MSRGVRGDARNASLCQPAIHLGIEPARVTRFARDCESARAVQHLARGLDQIWSEREARRKLQKQRAELRAERNDFVEECTDSRFAVRQSRYMGHGLWYLRTKLEVGGDGARPALVRPGSMRLSKSRVDLHSVENVGVSRQRASFTRKFAGHGSWNRPTGRSDSDRRDADVRRGRSGDCDLRCRVAHSATLASAPSSRATNQIWRGARVDDSNASTSAAITPNRQSLSRSTCLVDCRSSEGCGRCIRPVAPASASVPGRRARRSRWC